MRRSTRKVHTVLSWMQCILALFTRCWVGHARNETKPEALVLLQTRTVTLDSSTKLWLEYQSLVDQKVRENTSGLTEDDAKHNRSAPLALVRQGSENTSDVNEDAGKQFSGDISGVTEDVAKRNRSAAFALDRQDGGNSSDVTEDLAKRNYSTPLALDQQVSGNTSELTEEGYSKVAALKSRDDMKAFVVRLLSLDGKIILSEGSLNGILSYYDGTDATQSLEALRNELARADWVYPPNYVVSGNTTDLTDNGYLQVAALKSGEDMKAFVRRLLSVDGRSVRDENGLNGIAPYYDGTNLTQSLSALRNELATAIWVNQGPGRTEELSETGYQKVAVLHDEVQMKAFARRILNESEGEQKLDDARLVQILDYFDGILGIQDFDSLQEELQSNIETHGPSGRTAFLTQEGYQEVAAMKNDTEMQSFVKRLLHREGRSVQNQSGLREFTAFYSSNDTTPLLDIIKALEQAHWVDHGLGRIAPLSEEGYQSIAALQSDVQMKAFAQRILAIHGKSPMYEAELDTLIPFFDGWASVQDFESLEEALLPLED